MQAALGMILRQFCIKRKDACKQIWTVLQKRTNFPFRREKGEKTLANLKGCIKWRRETE